MKKELIGYKVKPEFREYFCNLVQASNDNLNYGVDFVEGVKWYKICKDAGVLDLWCEPVYKTKELPIVDGHKPYLLNRGKFVRYNNIEFSLDEIKEIIKFMKNYSVTSMTFFNKLTVKLEEFQQILDYVS